jgi:acyl-coenzyme A synthetase/AMP-(fatty) acid ligase
MKHPAVLMAAVVGNPDPVRGERVRAFVAAKPGIETAPGLSDAIRASVGERLAYYKAPGRCLSSRAAAHHDWEDRPSRVARLAKRND